MRNEIWNAVSAEKKSNKGAVFVVINKIIIGNN